MKLKQKTLLELKEILARDYGVSLSDDCAEQLGVALLRLTRVGVAALASANETRSFAEAREGTSLEPKTST